MARTAGRLAEQGANGRPPLASRAAAHAASIDPYSVADCWTARAGDTGQVTTLLDRDPAAHTSLDNPAGVARLLGALRRAGASGQVTTLPDRAAAHTSLDNPAVVANCWTRCARRGPSARSPHWPDRAAAHTSLDRPPATWPSC